jgi:hypothetical protein
LSKKKKIEALEDAEKLLPIDTLGVVMITHGEEFSENSAFGMPHPVSIQHDPVPDVVILRRRNIVGAFRPCTL